MSDKSVKVGQVTGYIVSALWLGPLAIGYWAFAGRPDYVAYRTIKLMLGGLALLTPLIFFGTSWLAKKVHHRFTAKAQ